jgi:tetratricopeptide (TPR) repeat protein
VAFRRPFFIVHPPKKVELTPEVAEKILQAEVLVEEGKELLRNFQAKTALKKFEEAINLAEGRLPLGLQFLCIWAQLMTLVNTDEDSLKTIGIQINQIPTAERDDPIYFFIKGLHEVKTNQPAAAEKSFNQALVHDPDFLEAKRELNTLKLRQRKGA